MTPPMLVDPELQASCAWCHCPARVAVRLPPWRLGPSNATVTFPALWLCLRHFRQLETGQRQP